MIGAKHFFIINDETIYKYWGNNHMSKKIAICFIFERNIIIFAMNISNMKEQRSVNKSIAQYLKSKIVAKGLTHGEVVGLLNKEGIKCTESSFTTKLNRGTFSASFFIQCLNILHCEVVDVKEIIKNTKE